MATARSAMSGNDSGADDGPVFFSFYPEPESVSGVETVISVTGSGSPSVANNVNSAASDNSATFDPSSPVNAFNGNATNVPLLEGMPQMPGPNAIGS